MMIERIIRPGVNCFVHAEGFDSLIVKSVLMKGSLAVDRGGLTIPWTNFCQSDS